MTRQEKIDHIKNNPHLHEHDFNGLQRCCFINGAVDLGVMDAHSQYVNMGTNGGMRCDVRRGPCACGAWH